MNKKKICIYIFIMLFSTTQAYCNMIWPVLLSEEKVTSIPIIMLSIIIEFFFFKALFNVSNKKAILFTLSANAASAILGLVLRPLSGIIWELTLGQIVIRIFDWGTFNPVAWFSVPIFGGAVNAIIELLTIRIIWKNKLSWKNFLLTWLINVITIGIAVAWYAVAPKS